MKQVIEKLLKWRDEETEILDELAHEVACSVEVESMLSSKQTYDLQKIKVDTIFDAIDLIQNQK